MSGRFEQVLYAVEPRLARQITALTLGCVQMRTVHLIRPRRTPSRNVS